MSNIKIADGSIPIKVEKYVHLDAINALYHRIGGRGELDEIINDIERDIKYEKEVCEKEPAKYLLERLKNLTEIRKNILRTIDLLKSFGKVGDTFHSGIKVEIIDELTKGLDISHIDRLHTGCYYLKDKSGETYKIKIEKSLTTAKLDSEDTQ